MSFVIIRWQAANSSLYPTFFLSSWIQTRQIVFNDLSFLHLTFPHITPQDPPCSIIMWRSVGEKMQQNSTLEDLVCIQAMDDGFPQLSREWGRLQEQKGKIIPGIIWPIQRNYHAGHKCGVRRNKGMKVPPRSHQKTRVVQVRERDNFISHTSPDLHGYSFRVNLRKRPPLLVYPPQEHCVHKIKIFNIRLTSNRIRTFWNTLPAGIQDPWYLL